MIRKRVAFIQRRLTHYRKPFFEKLKISLEEKNIELILIYGHSGENELLRRDNTEIDWAFKIRNKNFKIGRLTLIWQPCLKYLKNIDLIIVEQASKLLLNYFLFSLSLFSNKKLCFWGHGKNFQMHKGSRSGEFLKILLSQRVFWWFAYNDLSSDIIKSIGFRPDRITSVQNALDNEECITFYHKISGSALNEFKISNKLYGKNICLFSGSMYPEKRLKFLLGCCLKIKSMVPDFEMIFIGSGPDVQIIKKIAEEKNWLHYVGPKFEKEKVFYFKVSKLLLMPGLVGLGIVDSFSFLTPIVTTNISYHSPEIDYLISGKNGIMIDDTESEIIYANKVVSILKSPEIYDQLIEGCRESSNKYTMKKMVERFSDGISNALLHLK
jgi:glycosyltransferase involved in cell wall biosynthesis